MPNIAIQRRGGIPMWAVLVGVLVIALIIWGLFSGTSDRQSQPEKTKTPTTTAPRR